MAKVRRLASFALVTAVVLSLATQCLVGQEMTTAQMACCAATDHDCGQAAVAADCCDTERAEQERVVTQIHQPAPPVATVTSAILPLVRLADTYSAVVVDTTTLKATSP